MEQTVDQYIKIKGWGVDADPKTRPYYPVHKTQTETGAHWVKPEKQKIDMEILKSNEVGRMTAVFGTSVAPSGLSGIIRRFAFKFAENEYMHWLPLLLADRVNVVEGLIDDLLKGHIPNIFAEMGFGATYKYDRKLYYKRVAKTVAAVAVPTLIIYFLLKNDEE
jgi:hypothetical protein